MESEKIIKCVERTIQGDTKAFEELYKATNQRVYFICLQFLKNEHDAKDAVQDTYLSAYKNIRQLSEPSKFFSWVERIAVNVCKQMTRKNTPVPVEDEVLFENLVSENELVLPEEYIVDKEKRKVLFEIMQNTLSDLQYRTIILYYFGNFTVSEIAEMMDCTDGAVKNRLATSRAKIKKAIDEYQKDDKHKIFVFVGVSFLAKVFDEESKILNVPSLNTAMLTGSEAGIIKAGGIIMNKKILIGILVGAVAVGGISVGIIAGVSSNNKHVETDTSAISAVSEASVKQESISVGEPSKPESSVYVEESSDDSNKFNWVFKNVKEPVIEDTVYTEHPEKVTNGKPQQTAAPAIYLDFEKAEKIIRENPKFSSMEFVNQEIENQNFGNAASVSGSDQVFVSKTKWLRGSDKTLDEYKKYYAEKVGTLELGEDNVRIETKHEYTQYDKPNECSVYIKNNGITQDEVFELLKGIFNEPIAEYLVYNKPDDYKEGDDEFISSNYLKTSDGKGEYYFKFHASNFSFITEITYRDGNTSGNNNYKNNYQPMEWGFSFSDMLDVDFGNTDYNKPEDFFSKVLQYDTKYDPYERTTVESEMLDQIKFSDSSIMSEFEIKAHRISEPTETNIIQGSLEGNIGDQRGDGARSLNIGGKITRQKDGNIDIHSLSISFPTTVYVIDADYDAAIANECLEIAKQHAVDVFKLDKKIFDSTEAKMTDKEPTPSTKTRSLELTVKDVQFNIWKQDRKVSLEFGASGEGFYIGTPNVRSKYHSGFSFSVE